jgi:hypothetical protein
MDKLFPRDEMTKRERVQATLDHQPVDRAALHEQLSYNPAVIGWCAGRPISGFDFTIDDICLAIRSTLDMCFPPVAPRGMARVTTPDGFVFQNDQWTAWRVSRPFRDTRGALDWLLGRTGALRAEPFDPAAARAAYRNEMTDLQRRLGDTVILNYSSTGFCDAWDRMGLELFSFFIQDFPDALNDYLALSAAREEARVHAVADAALSPVILIPEDFATKQGPIFSPAFLRHFHYPRVRRLAEAWREHGVRVLYHSDGNYRTAIPDLMACGVDGFYCLEPGVGMDVVALKRRWPDMVWAGGVDGVDLMERGAPGQVRAEVRRQILETEALETGGLFVATSSEISPTIPVANYRAMLEAVDETRRAA